MLRTIANRARRRVARFNRIFTKTKELARNASEPRHFLHRRALANNLAREATLTIPRHAGFAAFERATFRTTDGLVMAGREIYARAQHEASRTPKADKTYFRNIMCADDLVTYPAILEFALDRRLLGSLARYFGLVPELCSVGLMLSSRSEQRVGSQHGHFDSQDSNHVKVIVAVEDVATENGPFEFLPADRSRRLREKHGLSFGFGGRFDDDEIFSQFPREQFVKMITRVGDGMIVDTSNCLHFGSRVERGSRLLWFLHFSTFADYQRMAATGNGAILMVHQPNRASFATDEVTRAALGIRAQ